MSAKEVTNFTKTKTKKKIVYDDDYSDSDDEIFIIKKSKGESKGESQMIYVWYDPAIGLPPGIHLPTGMKLPTHPCELYINKVT